MNQLLEIAGLWSRTYIFLSDLVSLARLRIRYSMWKLTNQPITIINRFQNIFIFRVPLSVLHRLWLLHLPARMALRDHMTQKGWSPITNRQTKQAQLVEFYQKCSGSSCVTKLVYLLQKVFVEVYYTCRCCIIKLRYLYCKELGIVRYVLQRSREIPPSPGKWRNTAIPTRDPELSMCVPQSCDRSEENKIKLLCSFF